jgi:acetyl-CoA acetyltransferase
LAGGAESMSRGPYWMPGARWGARMGETGLVDPVMGALTDPFESILMGVAADGIGPVPAVRKVLDRAGAQPSDIQVIELNEAFAAQALAAIDDLGLDEEIVNPNGGAIALGHPIGATGAAITAKILDEMERRDLELGLVTLCIGGGQGIAMLLGRG